MTNKVGGSWQDFYFTESQHFYRKEKKMLSVGQIRYPSLKVSTKH